ncbi:MAG: amidohydrolase family protein [Bauldia sp.]|nr:amidohydrolase family protein [Bauldia sp.]
MPRLGRHRVDLAARMPVFFTEGVTARRIGLAKFVDLVSTAPARLFGLYPQKGTIAVGCDADLVVWDAELEVTLTNALMHHAGDYIPYEGRKVKGYPSPHICAAPKSSRTARSRRHPKAASFPAPGTGSSHRAAYFRLASTRSPASFRRERLERREETKPGDQGGPPSQRVTFGETPAGAFP